jgi:hypothetical protein
VQAIPARGPNRCSYRSNDFSDEVSEHQWGRIVPFKDPDGNDLQLYAPPS